MAKKFLKSTSLNKRGGHPLPPRATSSSSERPRERTAERSSSNHQHNTYRKTTVRPLTVETEVAAALGVYIWSAEPTNVNTLTPGTTGAPSTNPATSPSAPPAHHLQARTIQPLHDEWRRRPCLPSPSLTSLSCKPKPLRTLSPHRSYRFQPPRSASPARFHRRIRHSRTSSLPQTALSRSFSPNLQIPQRPRRILRGNGEIRSRPATEARAARATAKEAPETPQQSQRERQPHL